MIFLPVADRCFPLPYVANATPDATDAVFGETRTLRCIDGHRFEGRINSISRSMRCQPSTGRWYPSSLPACERKHIEHS